MQRGRSLSGEIRGTFSELLLRRDEVTGSGGVSSELTNVLTLFVLVAAVQKIALDATSEDCASQQVIANYVSNQLAMYRPLSIPVPFQDVSGLVPYLSNYRQISNAYYDSVQYLNSPGTYLDLKAVIDGLQPRKMAAHQLFSEHHSLYSAQITKKRLVTENQLFVQEEFVYAPQAVNRKRFSTQVMIVPETHINVQITRPRGDPSYTLGNPDVTVNKGRIALYKDGLLVPGSEFQLLPQPLAHAHNLLSVTPGPIEQYFLNNPAAHSSSHPQSSGGSGGPVLGSLSLDVLSGSANLGKITGLLSDGSTVVSAQSTTAIHPTLNQFTSLQSSIALQDGINTGLHNLRASQVGTLQSDLAALVARVTQLEANALTFLGANGATAVAVKQIQISELPWAYYPTGEVLWIEKNTPLAGSPFT